MLESSGQKPTSPVQGPRAPATLQSLTRGWCHPATPPKVHEKPPAQGRTWGLRGELWRIGVCVPIP